jgi:hypothetical protein
MSNQGPLVLWSVLAALLLLAAGGSGVFLMRRKRARVASPSDTTLPQSSEG